MLIPTIQFVYKNEDFMVENTINNQYWILSNRFTRQIVFGNTFDFQFKNEKKMPAEMSRDVAWLDLIDSAQTNENELCDIDEMNGSYV